MTRWRRQATQFLREGELWRLSGQIEEHVWVLLSNAQQRLRRAARFAAPLLPVLKGAS